MGGSQVQSQLWMHTGGPVSNNAKQSKTKQNPETLTRKMNLQKPFVATQSEDLFSLH